MLKLGRRELQFLVDDVTLFASIYIIAACLVGSCITIGASVYYIYMTDA